MTLDAIQAAIPHREPFLLLDEIVEQSDDRILCRKTLTGDEFWFRGHYPNYPLMPGVLLVEAGMQAGAVLVAKRAGADKVHGADRSAAVVPVATRINNVKFKHIVRPGDTIEVTAEVTEVLAEAYFLKARITLGGKTAATFDFACTLAAPPA